MSKAKIPEMSEFLGSVMTDQVQAAVPMPAAKAPEVAKRRTGRPKKAPDDLAKQTAIRLDPEDLRRVKKLAVDDGMTFNRVIYRALEAYCAARGVRLLGSSRN